MNTKSKNATKSKIGWSTLTPAQLYLLQYYGNTKYVRDRAKHQLLKKSS